jgi:hypothetical protein
MLAKKKHGRKRLLVQPAADGRKIIKLINWGPIAGPREHVKNQQG